MLSMVKLDVTEVDALHLSSHDKDLEQQEEEWRREVAQLLNVHNVVWGKKHTTLTNSLCFHD